MESNPLEESAELFIKLAGPGLEAMPAEERGPAVEYVLTGAVRLAVKYFNPAKVAAKLRELADAIEAG